ncbi:hypothetical protein [Aureispira sp. CCB-QB1]|uniref:hypothetical protein n=1 Tax=Aureispira sp. CCB-QB1 TaxID=1313421 RepID=UPI0012DEC504|nr:hypothetical protein [Aureispira sp. CCB-QB1]
MKITYPPNKYSLLAIFLFLTIALTHRDSFRVYLKPYKVISFDMGGYYVYLPAFFIHQSTDFSFIHQQAKQSGKVYITSRDGKKVEVNKYSMGPAILLSPFFLLGHLEAYYWQVPRDGFSYTYLFWMITGTIFYTSLALFLLRAVLLRYYKDVPVAITLLILGLGTNLFFYTVYEFLMSHAFSFFLFSLALFLAIKWLERPTLLPLLALSFVAGMLAMTRLPNMIFFLVLAFWNVCSIESLKNRLLLFKTHWKALGIGLLFFALPFVPQLLYWKTVVGFYLMNGYTTNGENFIFSQPHIFEILLGYRKGWLVYSPVLLLGFVGLLVLLKKHKNLFGSLAIYIVINIYVVSCWWCWSYGGSFGMRALVEASVVLSIPLAALLQELSKSPLISHFLTIFITACLCLNMFQSYQYHHGIIHWSRMTQKSYWAVFGVTHPAHPYHIYERDKYLLKSGH